MNVSRRHAKERRSGGEGSSIAFDNFGPPEVGSNLQGPASKKSCRASDARFDSAHPCADVFPRGLRTVCIVGTIVAIRRLSVPMTDQATTVLLLYFIMPVWFAPVWRTIFATALTAALLLGLLPYLEELWRGIVARGRRKAETRTAGSKSMIAGKAR